MNARSIALSLAALALFAAAGCASPAGSGGAAPNPGGSGPAGNAPASATPTATATARPTATASPSPLPPTETPAPTATPTPAPTPAPTPQPSLRRLTTGGCCVQPFFSPDGATVLFIDKPAPDAPAGIYGVDLNDASNRVQLVDEIVGFRSPDGAIVARPDETDPDVMRFTDERAGDEWLVDTNGNWPVFSPDGRQIFWNATDRDGPYDERRTDVWLANVDGSQARQVISLYGGGALDWFPDGRRLLVSGRPERVGEEESLFVLSLADGATLELARDERLRAETQGVSPGGTWVAYFITFSPEPGRDGIWLVRADGAGARRLDFWGAYRWRDDARLVYVPMRASPEESMVLWEYDAGRGASRPLTDPAALPFVISNGDWTVSPDGQHVVFVSAEDKNLWLITLP